MMKDRQKALDILGLGVEATYEDAREAFRRLAKIHHPDSRSAGPGADKAAGDKMKQINLAFGYLSGVLERRPPRPPPAPRTPTDQTDRGDSPLKTETKKGIFHSVSAFVKQARTAVKPARRPVRPKAPGSSRRKTSSRGSARAGYVRFEDVLGGAGESGTRDYHRGGPLKNNRKRSGDRPRYAGFESYLRLKKQMKRRRRQKGVEIGRVEKISPVRPVRRVGD